MEKTTADKKKMIKHFNPQQNYLHQYELHIWSDCNRRYACATLRVLPIGNDRRNNDRMSSIGINLLLAQIYENKIIAHNIYY